MKLDTNQSICIIVVPATGKYQLPIIILTGTTLCVLMIKGEVTGYFSYHINWITKSIDSLGLISFINNNIILINDVIKHLIYLLDHVGINRIEFWAYADNPAVDGYEKLVKKIGGERIATLHQVEMLSDGKLHDMCVFEILHKNSEIARKHF